MVRLPSGFAHFIEIARLLELGPGVFRYQLQQDSRR